jgi:MFS family permease
MHRKFAAWLSDRPGRAALFAAIFGALSLFGIVPFLVAAGAVPVLVALRIDVRAGVQAAMGGSAAVIAVWLAADQSVLSAVGFAAGLFWVPLALAVLLRRTGSLNLCFQLVVLGAGILLALLYLGFDNPVAHWQQLLQEITKTMMDMELITDQQVAIDSLATSIWGVLVTVWVLMILGALLLGRWWQLQIDTPGAFGLEYRQLQFGKVLGVLALLAVIGGFTLTKFGFKAPVVDAWMLVAMTGLALQGLAAAHKFKARGLIGRGWLTAIYLLLIVPLSTMLMIVLLAGWGLADNWQRSRARGA